MLTIILPAGALAALVAAVPITTRVWTSIPWLAVAAATPFLLMRGLVPHVIAANQAWLWYAGVGMALAALTALLLSLQVRAPVSTAFGMGITAGTTAPCLLAGHYASVVPISMGIGTGLAIAFVMLVTIGRSWKPVGVAPLAMIGLGGLWILCHFYADMRLLHIALLVSSVVLLWVEEIPACKRLRPWQNGLVRIAIAAIPALISAAHATYLYIEEYRAHAAW